MGINGVLEDLPLADVLQFVHLGGRTGTLYLWRDDNRRAEIGFHFGRIVTAWAEGQPKLGEKLVEEGLLSPITLEDAATDRRREGVGTTLAEYLLRHELIARGGLRRTIAEHVQTTISHLVTWRHGSFHFEVDELQPADDFSMAPGQLLADMDLNTQMLLLEATRIHDEEEHATDDDTDQSVSELDRRLRRAGLSRGAEGERRDGARERSHHVQLESLRCQVMTEEQALLGALRDQLGGRDAASGDEHSEARSSSPIRVVPIKLREAGTRMPGESIAPIVVLDLRHDQVELDDVASLARTRPGAPLVVLTDDPTDARKARGSGAVAVLSPSDPTLVPTVRNLARVASHQRGHTALLGAARGGFSRFRRVVFDVQSGLLSATMALNLMHLISESVERAVLFLVQDEGLEAVGAFGFSANSVPLAEETRQLHLEVPSAGCLWMALDEGKPISVDFESAGLPPSLARLVGRPASGQVVVFPVLGAERPIALLYTDNGAQEFEIEDIRILELATSQVGVAFENELLRRRLGDLDLGVEDQPAVQKA
ncbi:MAG: DUF4388 domain-containing protein [Thermoanaerobaculia bacterium]|nr:DUF4388 domain-containing protein [Thermoanaerobaculia bacterium]